jgi:UDP-N-acetylglucosamine--N-acetylmuramyl-(pentapeptide) pyrophosphoryl-undecaprenol N-acetylglucosamine transferase
MGLQKDLPTILVIGGSLGARTINNSIAAGIQRFEQAGIQVVWQTGKFYAEECERKAKEANAKIVRPQAFISDMATAYKAADIVISRAGASSISELCLLGKASILVPSPNVAEDHQTKNARALSDKGAAVFVPDNQAERTLVEEAVALVSNATAIEKLEQEVKKLALPDSADIIADEVLKLVKNS